MTNTPVATKMMLVDNILKLFEENTHNRKYAPGYFGLAQPIPQETTPVNFPLQTRGPPLSP